MQLTWFIVVCPVWQIIPRPSVAHIILRMRKLTVGTINKYRITHFRFWETKKCCGKWMQALGWLLIAIVQFLCVCTMVLVHWRLFISTFIQPLFELRAVLWVIFSLWTCADNQHKQTYSTGFSLNSPALQNYSRRAHFPRGKRFFSASRLNGVAFHVVPGVKCGVTHTRLAKSSPCVLALIASPYSERLLE